MCVSIPKIVISGAPRISTNILCFFRVFLPFFICLQQAKLAHPNASPVSLKHPYIYGCRLKIINRNYVPKDKLSVCNDRQNMANGRQNCRNNTVAALLSYSQFILSNVSRWTFRIVKSFVFSATPHPVNVAYR
jgi:hypothetical protein